MTDNSALFPPNDADDEVRDRIHSAVTAVVMKMGGKDAFETRPWLPGSELTHTVPKARYAMHAAKKLRDAANGQLRRYIDDVRAEGRSWLEIGVELGLGDRDGVGADEAAFYLVATGDRFNPYTSWRCRTCNEVVTDRGPFNDHPSDVERGHAEDCTRLAAAISAWRKRRDED